MPRLFVQIPCLNEERTLPLVIAGLPRQIEGIDEICILVIDDGSSDSTVESAAQLGVDYIVKNGRNLGLAKTYSRGLEACLFLGADIIVNTDGDNQYVGEDIGKLVKPIIEQQADFVIGCRNIVRHQEFSSLKKTLQKIGSSFVGRLSGTDVPDTTSGFRAVNRCAAIRLSVMSTFSYTLETLIQAGRTGLKVDWVPIETNKKLRESRLFKSASSFISQQLKIMLWVYIFYCPMRFFGWLALFSFAVAILNAARIFYFLFLTSPGDMKFKAGSGALLLLTTISGVLFLIAGLLGSVLSGLRFLIADLRTRARNVELDQNIAPLDIEIITVSDRRRDSAVEHRNANNAKGKEM